WSTVFQGPAFVTTWYDVYRDRKRPLILEGRGADGSLVGLLTLAEDVESGVVTCAGAPIAEYQTWLAAPEAGDTFALRALEALSEGTQAPLLRFLCLAPGSPVAWCREASARAVLRSHRRPLLSLTDPGALEAPFRKKSTKRKLARLRREGEVRLEQLETGAALDAHLDEIVAEYDLRQGAAYGVAPFTGDPLMRTLYRRLADESGCLHATVLLAGDSFAAGHIGFINGDEVLLGIIAHSSSLAAASPGMLLIRFVARLLGEQGYRDFDLTIGGDYKWRFATHEDEVQVLDVHLNAASYRRQRWRRGAVSAARRVARSAGLGEDRLRDQMGAVARRVAHVRRQPVGTWPGLVWEHLFGTRQIRLYYRDRPPTLDPMPDSRAVQRDALQPLLGFTGERHPLTPMEFLELALRRREMGATPYSVAEQGRLLYRGWVGPAECVRTIAGAEALEVPQNASLLFGDGVHPDAHQSGAAELVLRTRLADLGKRARDQPVLVFADPETGLPAELLGDLGFREWGRIQVGRGLARRNSVILNGPDHTRAADG
ncbi:MAG: GNAT family N-acetyltransferase, partial [Gemmatimonadetes bacterium]|nr:GNAT family N-acetyltransferase [Gemmatimonadota bacterium]